MEVGDLNYHKFLLLIIYQLKGHSIEYLVNSLGIKEIFVYSSNPKYLTWSHPHL